MAAYTVSRYCVYRHQAREAEPKDYSLNNDPVRDLHHATYQRMGTVTDGVRILAASDSKATVMY